VADLRAQPIAVFSYDRASDEHSSAGFLSFRVCSYWSRLIRSAAQINAHTLTHLVAEILGIHGRLSKPSPLLSDTGTDLESPQKSLQQRLDGSLLGDTYPRHLFFAAGSSSTPLRSVSQGERVSPEQPLRLAEPSRYRENQPLSSAHLAKELNIALGAAAKNGSVTLLRARHWRRSINAVGSARSASSRARLRALGSALRGPRKSRVCVLFKVSDSEFGFFLTGRKFVNRSTGATKFRVQLVGERFEILSRCFEFSLNLF